MFQVHFIPNHFCWKNPVILPRYPIIWIYRAQNLINILYNIDIKISWHTNIPQRLGDFWPGYHPKRLPAKECATAAQQAIARHLAASERLDRGER